MFLQQTITTWGEIAALAKLIELYPKKIDLFLSVLMDVYF